MEKDINYKNDKIEDEEKNKKKFLEGLNQIFEGENYSAFYCGTPDRDKPNMKGVGFMVSRINKNLVLNKFLECFAEAEGISVEELIKMMYEAIK